MQKKPLKKRKPSRIKDGIIVLLLLAITAVVIHFSVNHQARTQLWVDMYPLRARLALLNNDCQGSAASWIKPIVSLATKQGNAPANQMVYISPKEEISRCSSGYREKPLISDKVTAKTRFRYASVTKLFTSDAILALIRQGKLQLKTRLVDVISIPEPKDQRVNEITIADLLSHRGGFDRLQQGSEDMFYYDREPLCPNQLAKLSTIQLNFKPGTKVAYSNLGYCLLGEVIRVVSGKPYQDYMNEHYDLKSDNILFNQQSLYADEVSYNYVNQSLTAPVTSSNFYKAYDFKGLSAVAGLSGSALSLAKQVRRLLGNEAQPNILSRNTHYHCDYSVIRDCYGYAMIPYQSGPKSLKIYFREGNLEGLASLVVVDEHGGVTVLLSNGVESLQKSDEIKMLIYQQLEQKYRAVGVTSD